MANTLASDPTGSTAFASAEPPSMVSDGPTTRQFILLTATFWVAEFVLAELRSVVDHSVKLELYTVLRTISAAFGCLEFYLIHLAARATGRRHIRYRSALLLGLAALAGIINLKTIDLLQNLSAFPVSDYGLGWRVYNATYWCLMFMAWAAIYLAFDYNREAVGQERRARMLEQLAHDAQLRALRFQIDPHFLFNTLNSVSALVLEGRNQDAERMIENLSEFFRTTLVQNPRKDVRLEDEITFQQVYLEIEKVRFPDLLVHLDIHVASLDILVPPLLLQPLVENAVKFAAAARIGRATIGIKVGPPSADVVVVEIWDDGSRSDPRTPKGTGTGLANVRDRLRTRYGERATLEIQRREPHGTIVRLAIPLTTG